MPEKTGEKTTSPVEKLPEEFRDAIESYYKNLNSFEKGK
jgi:hypothetical protein